MLVWKNSSDGFPKRCFVEDGWGASVVEVAGGIGWNVRDLEALSHFAFAELRGSLVSLVGVFVVDGRVMSFSILAALDHQE